MPVPKDPARIREMLTLLDKSIELHQRMVETQHEMKRSLSLALVWPGVWDGGKIGTLVRYTTYSASCASYAGRDARFVILRDGEEAFECSIWDVPTMLWPANILAATRRSPFREKLKVRQQAEATESEVK